MAQFRIRVASHIQSVRGVDVGGKSFRLGLVIGEVVSLGDEVEIAFGACRNRLRFFKGHGDELLLLGV